MRSLKRERFVEGTEYRNRGQERDETEDRAHKLGEKGGGLEELCKIGEGRPSQ